MSRMEVMACLCLGIALTALASPATVGTEDNGRMIWIADAHRDGHRLIVRPGHSPAHTGRRAIEL